MRRLTRLQFDYLVQAGEIHSDTGYLDYCVEHRLIYYFADLNEEELYRFQLLRALLMEW